MISYAQNREDVLLRRAFPGPVGFYIDIGAAHPISHSVTKWFYQCGWTGVNVEPLFEFHHALTADRPRDVNLNAVVTDRSGEITFYEVPSEMGWATADGDTAAKYRSEGLTVVPRSVPTLTLAELCERYVTGPIDFLKIDVEGGERAVLAGADFGRWRPRVMLLEATEVGRPVPNYAAWEPVVLGADYLFAAFDGLNRYYVRAEDRELLPRFAEPVNVFDDYELAETVQVREQLDRVRAELAHVRSELADAARSLEKRAEEVEALRRAVADHDAAAHSLRRVAATSRHAYDVAIQLLHQTRADADALRSHALKLAG